MLFFKKYRFSGSIIVSGHTNFEWSRKRNCQLHYPLTFSDLTIIVIKNFKCYWKQIPLAFMATPFVIQWIVRNNFAVLWVLDKRLSTYLGKIVECVGNRCVITKSSTLWNSEFFLSSQQACRKRYLLEISDESYF